MSIIRGYAYVPHEPETGTEDGYWFELTGTQAKVAKDFRTQTYIHNRKLEKVPTYKLDNANVYSTKKAKPVNRDRYISKMFLRGDSVILVLRNPLATAADK